MADLKGIVINDQQMLVTPIPDYFASKKANGPDFSIKEFDEFNVGIVDKVGDKLPQEWTGHIVYYHKGVAMNLRLKNIGDYQVIGNDQKILVRMDQNRNEY